jgi:hypothetical protein
MSHKHSATRPDDVPDTPPLENVPLEIEKEDIRISGRKPDMEEYEEDEAAL